MLHQDRSLLIASYLLDRMGFYMICRQSALRTRTIIVNFAVDVQHKAATFIVGDLDDTVNEEHPA